MDNNPSPTVLMYHGIVPDTQPMPRPERELGAPLYDVSLENFKSQMAWLKDNGFTPVIIDPGQSSFFDNVLKPVILTFDDGEMNNYQYVFPVLQQLGWKAYFFIIIKRIGENGYMGLNQLKELQKAGMIIGSHGLTHEILTNLLDSQMEEELRASKKNLEINLGVPIDTLSVPRGFCNDKILETAYRLGFKTVFISDKPAGLKSKCYPRIPIKAGWSLKRFDLALKGKIPGREILGNILIKCVKILLRESGYNWARGILIRIFQ